LYPYQDVSSPYHPAARSPRHLYTGEWPHQLEFRTLLLGSEHTIDPHLVGQARFRYVARYAPRWRPAWLQAGGDLTEHGRQLSRARDRG
jgi:hypothetical protein